MAASETIFLFELAIEELRSFIKAGNFRIRAKFGNVFLLRLKDPNEVYVDALLAQSQRIKRGKRLKSRKLEQSMVAVPSGQSVLVVSDVDSLLNNMMLFPIEITLTSKDDPYILGIVQIPWTSAHIEYVKNININKDLPPAIIRDKYKLFDEYASKRVAVMNLKVKITKMTEQTKSNFSTKYPMEGLHTEYSLGKLNSDFTRALTTNKPLEFDSEYQETGVIKTIYSSGKRKKKSGFGKKKLKHTSKEKNHDSDLIPIVDDVIEENVETSEKVLENENANTIAITDEAKKGKGNGDSHSVTVVENKTNLHSPQSIVKEDRNVDVSGTISLVRDSQIKDSLASLVRSQTHLDSSSPKCLLGVTKHWSSTSLEIKERLDTLNYIFGNLDGPFGNQVYCVGYFTVENDYGLSAGSPNTGTGTGTPNPTSGTSSPDTGTGTGPSNTGTGTPNKGARSLKRDSGSPKPGTRSPPKQGPSTPGQGAAPEKNTKLPQAPPVSVVATKSDGVLRGSGKYSFKVCGEQCKLINNNSCFENICSLDLPEAAAHLISLRKCTEVTQCPHKKLPSDKSSSDEHIVMDFTNPRPQDCCIQKVEEVVGGVTAKLKPSEDPCFCTCECTFGFVKKTTYCNICGGYEIAGDEVEGKRGGAPFPCPIYHNLTDKGKKGLGQSSSGGDARKKTVLTAAPDLDTAAADKGKKSFGLSSPAADARRRTLQSDAGDAGAAFRAKSKSISPGEKRSVKSNESDKESSKKGKKKKIKDERFKFNYGYKAPQIGHSQCALPCTGHLLPVPKHMGWLWNANNIPGLKFRPNWRPGAANKHVVRLLKIAKHPEIVINKRRRKDTGKKKRPLKRPLLIVQKKDGEYNVTMETMRTFTRQRTVNMYPYEDKPLVTYTIGRTEEENRERQKRKARQQRRVEREQRAFIQSAFQDMCKEICIRSYQQALGILPYAEDLSCPCYPIEPDPNRVDEYQSCSCTESTRSSGSVTDDDEWIVEFTPPNAYFNPEFVPKKVVKVDNSTQYTYLDYKVKLLDRYGNPVPRFFIGPDGKQQCSDLGGFWGPNKKWLEINVDGFIAPDGRWAPNNFIGPCGEIVEAESGKFQATNGVWLVVGVDGYVNSENEWCFYPKPKVVSKDPRKHRNVEDWKKAGGCKGTGDGVKHDKYDHDIKPIDKTWSCFGDASPRTLSQMGIKGHGHDRRLLLATLKRMMADGENITMPETPTIPKMPRKKGKKKSREETMESHQQLVSHQHLRSRQYISERGKCKHRQPSSKGIVAVNERGRKTYFTLRDYKNPRPKDRILKLGENGISLSSFHVPCFSSFISSEAARQQQIEHILQHNARAMQTTGA